jgi:ferredoxin/Ni/Fe-hydrogenase subunit HybB-like protein
VHALEKRPDGIVDVDPGRCIGCKSCLQGCPYDALYINDDTGTAQKCHFCAHRVERGLAPACAVVCPTEAIVPGDFDDPASVVSGLRADGGMDVRKPEAGTGPNVFYRDVSPAGIDPLTTHSGGGHIWADRHPSAALAPALVRELEARAEARTVYDVAHPAPWGPRVSAYLFTKSLAAGLFLAALPLLFSLPRVGVATAPVWAWAGGLSLVFLAITAVLLIADLKRPERFWYILRYANWTSWLARGSVILGAYGGLLALATGAGLAGAALSAGATLALAGVGALAAVLTAIYTAWLFRQARGRVLWMRHGMAWSLFVHACVAGAAGMLLVAPWTALADAAIPTLRVVLAASLTVHLLTTVLFEHRGAPARRESEFHVAARLITHGPFAVRHWAGGVALGIAAPLVMLLLPSGSVGAAGQAAAALAALAGLFIEQDNLVRAGQALPIS